MAHAKKPRSKKVKLKVHHAHTAKVKHARKAKK